MDNKKSLSLLLVAGLLAALLGAGAKYWWRDNGAVMPDVARKSAQFSSVFYLQSMQDLAGQPHPFSQYQGQWVIMNFWGTWCPPCVDEMPELDGIYKTISKNGIIMLGVAIDSPSAVRAFQDQVKVTYPLVLGGFEGTELATALGNKTGGLPYTVIIDPNGDVAWQKGGRIDAAKLLAAVERLTAAAPPDARSR